MRKPAGVRLTPRSLSQLLDGQRVGGRARAAVGVAIGLGLTPLWLAAQPAPVGRALPATPASVMVEFLGDGRCHVSAEGVGFRSDATYRPQTTLQSGELRCAMPPVRKGLTVDLTVRVPHGSRRPAGSEPSLEWTAAADGRWTGTGSLTDWPDVIVVASPGRTWTFWGSAAITLILAAAALRRRRARPAGAA